MKKKSTRLFLILVILASALPFYFSRADNTTFNNINFNPGSSPSSTQPNPSGSVAPLYPIESSGSGFDLGNIVQGFTSELIGNFLSGLFNEVPTSDAGAKKAIGQSIQESIRGVGENLKAQLKQMIKDAQAYFLDRVLNVATNAMLQKTGQFFIKNPVAYNQVMQSLGTVGGVNNYINNTNCIPSLAYPSVKNAIVGIIAGARNTFENNLNQAVNSNSFLRNFPGFSQAADNILNNLQSRTCPLVISQTVSPNQLSQNGRPSLVGFLDKIPYFANADQSLRRTSEAQLLNSSQPAQASNPFSDVQRANSQIIDVGLNSANTYVETAPQLFALDSSILNQASVQTNQTQTDINNGYATIKNCANGVNCQSSFSSGDLKKIAQTAMLTQIQQLPTFKDSLNYLSNYLTSFLRSRLFGLINNGLADLQGAINHSTNPSNELAGSYTANNIAQACNGMSQLSGGGSGTGQISNKACVSELNNQKIEMAKLAQAEATNLATSIAASIGQLNSTSTIDLISLIQTQLTGLQAVVSSSSDMLDSYSNQTSQTWLNYKTNVLSENDQLQNFQAELDTASATRADLSSQLADLFNNPDITNLIGQLNALNSSATATEIVTLSQQLQTDMNSIQNFQTAVTTPLNNLSDSLYQSKIQMLFSQEGGFRWANLNNVPTPFLVADPVPSTCSQTPNYVNLSDFYSGTLTTNAVDCLHSLSLIQLEGLQGLNGVGRYRQWSTNPYGPSHWSNFDQGRFKYDLILLANQDLAQPKYKINENSVVGGLIGYTQKLLSGQATDTSWIAPLQNYYAEKISVYQNLKQVAADNNLLNVVIGENVNNTNIQVDIGSLLNALININQNANDLMTALNNQFNGQNSNLSPILAEINNLKTQIADLENQLQTQRNAILDQITQALANLHIDQTNFNLDNINQQIQALEKSLNDLETKVSDPSLRSAIMLLNTEIHDFTTNPPVAVNINGSKNQTTIAGRGFLGHLLGLVELPFKLAGGLVANIFNLFSPNKIQI